jgi:hypothetical protein
MTDLSKPPAHASSEASEAATAADGTAASRARRPYQPPHCEKKRSIHRVTLLSGMGVMSTGALSMTG